MCLTYCHRRRVIYWNHSDCDRFTCKLAGKPTPPCKTCRHHRTDGRCGLTRSPLPAGGGGCCHHNVEPLTGLQPVSRETLAPLAIRPDETVAAVLQREGIDYRQAAPRLYLVDPLSLSSPYTFGVGTDDHLPDEQFDWSDWFEQWDIEEGGTV